MTKQITKISIDGIKITIAFQEPNDRAKDGFITSLFKCEEEPSPDFNDALQKFLPDLIYEVGLDETLWSSADIVGMTFKHTELGIAIAVTGTCDINENKPRVTSSIHTPQDTPTILEIEAVLKEAMLYVEGGKRSQQSLL
jgi:hypothetical protein